jgi:hypothetical protein
MTARSTIGPLQTALYGVLNGDATLGALITGVFAPRAPEGQQKPYVVIGDAYATPRSAHDAHGRRTVETIHVWDDQPSLTRITQILDRITVLLDHQTLTVAGHDAVLVHHDFEQVMSDPDPEIQHGILRLAITTEQTT